MGKGQLCPGTQPVGELSRGVEAAHAEDLLELRQGVEVLGARGACGQGAAGRQLIDAEPGLQVVEQEAHLGLCPHPDDAHAQRLIAVGVTDPHELPGQIRSLQVVQRKRIDDPLVSGRHGPLIHAQDESRPAGAFDAMGAESLQVLALGGIVSIVPVADVDEVDGVRGQAAGPVDQLRQRSRRRLGPEETSRFAVADMQQVGQGIMRAYRVDEIALKALRDQDRGHLRGSGEEPQDAGNWPIASIGRILSPRSVAESDGE